MNKNKKHIQKKDKTLSEKALKSKSPKRLLASKFSFLIPLLAFLLYSNTLSHDYTQDDAIVIYDNMFTQKGFSGIPGLLTNDTFYGFFKTEGKAKLVSGGRYRPLTPVMFAIEYQFFGKNPFIGHLINILLYALLCFLIYKMLDRLIRPRFGSQKGYFIFLFGAAMLFTLHPIHTEVVANIKGRDEIMSMMGAVLATIFTLRYIDEGKKINILWVGLCMFLGLMSKENTITYLAVIPLMIYFFRSDNMGKFTLPFLSLLAGSIIFLIIRFSILGFDMGGAPMELMNNPFIKIQGNMYVPFSSGEKFATIFYTLGLYIYLLIFPNPLTHDYYPRHIEIMNFGDGGVLLSISVYLILIIFALWRFRTKSVVSFCILYFLVTLSIVSNIVFPIGTNMSERFMFMPSLGFTLLLSYLTWQIFKDNKKALYVLVPIFLAYSVKTFTRNRVWKNDFTLFTTDVKTSKNSAKVLNAAGGALVTESTKTENQIQKGKYLDEAIPYLQKALSIHPNYKNAALLLGNAHFYKKDYDQAIRAYEQAIKIDPNYKEANVNLAIALRDGARFAGEKQQDFTKAKKYLQRSLSLNDADIESYRLMGITFGVMGDHKNAIKYFEKVVKMDPENAGSYVNLGKAYKNYGDEESYKMMLQKAVTIDPNALDNF